MLPLVSFTTLVLLAALVAMAIALGGLIGALIVRARRDGHGRPPGSHHDGQADRSRELVALRARIEELSDRHADLPETQDRLLARRLSSLQERLDSGSRQLEALRDQLMDEIQRRDAEMDTLRGQLLSVLHMARAETRSRRSVQESTGGQDDSDASLFSADYFREFNELDSAPATEAKPTVPSAPIARVEVDQPPSPGRRGSAPEGPSPGESVDRPVPHDPFELVGSRNMGRFSPDLYAEEPSEAAPDLEPLEELLEFLPDVADGDGPASESHHEIASGTSPLRDEEELADAALGDRDRWKTMDAYQLDEPPVRSPASPARAIDSDLPPALAGAGGDGQQTASGDPGRGGADDLTHLPMIDATRQRQLNALGIHTIEDVARLTRADARRVVRTIRGVSEEAVMDRWVFAAQSILYDRFRAELRAGDPRA